MKVLSVGGLRPLLALWADVHSSLSKLSAASHKLHIRS